MKVNTTDHSRVILKCVTWGNSITRLCKLTKAVQTKSSLSTGFRTTCIQTGLRVTKKIVVAVVPKIIYVCENIICDPLHSIMRIFVITFHPLNLLLWTRYHWKVLSINSVRQFYLICIFFRDNLHMKYMTLYPLFCLFYISHSCVCHDLWSATTRRTVGEWFELVPCWKTLGIC
jgi:hypothetical protein